MTQKIPQLPHSNCKKKYSFQKQYGLYFRLIKILERAIHFTTDV
jgi:hypothetical protein